MNKLQKTLVCVLLLLCSLPLMAFAPLPQAIAPRPTRTPRSGENADKELNFALQREQNWLERQALALNNAHSAATRAQTLIDKAKAKGTDVTALQTALDSFNTQVAAAQTSHDQAAAILATKAGFDANGQVVDRETAHQTLVSARDNLRQAHLTLRKATLDLRTAIQAWRQQHKSK
jgi:hypothetical protein